MLLKHSEIEFVAQPPASTNSVVLIFSDTTLELSVMPKDEDILQVVSFLQIEIVS